MIGNPLDAQLSQGEIRAVRILLQHSDAMPGKASRKMPHQQGFDGDGNGRI
ncbi:hypothetical protein D3C83_179710 [compost metagenome]